MSEIFFQHEKRNFVSPSLARDRKSPQRGSIANLFGQRGWFSEKSVRQTA